MQTTRTKYNKNINNRSKQEVKALSNIVARLTFVSVGSNNKDKDKEDIEGYSVVNVVSVTKANATRVEKPKAQEKFQETNPKAPDRASASPNVSSSTGAAVGSF